MSFLLFSSFTQSSFVQRFHSAFVCLIASPYTSEEPQKYCPDDMP